MKVINVKLDNNPPNIYNVLNIEGFIKYQTHNLLIKDVLRKTKPNKILEVGFYHGASTFLWLYNSNADIVSVDSMYCKYTSIYVNKVRQFISLNNLCNLYRDRLKFLLLDSTKLLPFIENQKFDLFFIDGDHTVEGADNDFKIALKINCPYILIDDVMPDCKDSHVYNLFVKEYTKYFNIVNYYKTSNCPYKFNMILAKRK